MTHTPQRITFYCKRIPTHQLEKEKYTKEKWAKAIYKDAIYNYFYKHVIHRKNVDGL